MYDAFFAHLAKEDVEYKRNLEIKQYSSVKIGGSADVAIFPDTIEKLISALKFLKQSGITYRIVGKMSNILADDKGYRGVLVFTTSLNRFSRSGCFVCAECGALFSSVILRCSKYSIGGAEALFGIPGTVGGMAYSNAGAYGAQIADFLIDALVYDVDADKVFTLNNSELSFEYRRSIFEKRRLVLLRATFLFRCKRQADILTEIGKIKEKRLSEQPCEYPTLGSVFKKANGVSAGKLIDIAGMKGYSVGGAEISSKHAGFVINKNESTSEDFKKIIRDIKSKIASLYEVVLDEEIEYL